MNFGRLRIEFVKKASNSVPDFVEGRDYELLMNETLNGE